MTNDLLINLWTFYNLQVHLHVLYPKLLSLDEYDTSWPRTYTFQPWTSFLQHTGTVVLSVLHYSLAPDLLTLLGSIVTPPLAPYPSLAPNSFRVYT
jgi:hypothetical protein